MFFPGKPSEFLLWSCAHQRTMLRLLWCAEVQTLRATLAALVPCRALLKSSAPGEGSPNWSHAERLASLSLPKHIPSLPDCLAVGQWVCCVGARLDRALGSGLHRCLSTALQSQPTECEPALPRDSSGPARCPQSKQDLSSSVFECAPRGCCPRTRPGHGTGSGASLCPLLIHGLPLKLWVTYTMQGCQKQGHKSHGVPKCL